MRKLRGERSAFDRSSDRRERHSEKDRRYRDRSPRRREKERSAKREHIDEDSDREHKSSSKRHSRRYEKDEGGSEHDRESSSRSHRRHRDEERHSRKQRDSSRSRYRSSKHSRDDRSESPRRSRSRPRSSRHKNDDADHERLKVVDEYSPRRSNGKGDYTSHDESDPLEDLVGPLPVSSRGKKEDSAGVSVRGRGSYRPKTSTIDSHFARDYNPNLDVDISDNDEESSSKQRSARRPVAGLMTEDDDWDMALEALRDRANWRQRGEERLRAAGFDDSTVQRWKQDPAFAAGGGSNDTEGRIEDVKWAKKGEGREWDRGKVMNDDGHFDVKAQW